MVFNENIQMLPIVVSESGRPTLIAEKNVETAEHLDRSQQNIDQPYCQVRLLCKHLYLNNI